ncbi:carbon-nitrogen hydrolase family protein [Vibrio cincinnatiensis]|uniref:carbon-nitrogen hydrolase family protein n=1 Tax=Vibrio cincinnatiensis TaxID=675 RepID=UPI001EDD1927|nr:carbon-nitrogen hydrolase family protein [Vibrio cincinnatiensis]MCG3759243.1 carbon-nitrogen hydrolase family protein [Vibrio cincinnatiensis]MCG3762510.1 carbon-nitrogen hydrolase family protein [Vibrio cincinnatiensis]
MARMGLIQMTSGSSIKENLQVIEQNLQQLVKQKVEWVVTPENALLFGRHFDYHHHAESLKQGVIQQQLSALASRYQVWLLMGSFPIRREHGVTSTSILFNPQGELVADYDKLHMFDVDVTDGHRRYRESETFIPGNRVTVVETPLGMLGLSICYDLRFPHLYSELRQKGAQILFVLAAFTAVTGKAHWQVLLQARAIETQCWVVAVGQTGVHPCGRETWGHSMVVSPWGEVVASLGQDAECLVVDIEVEQTVPIRRAMPVMEHTRFYNQLIEKKNPL